jgi:hypothetical protein
MDNQQPLDMSQYEDAPSTGGNVAQPSDAQQPLDVSQFEALPPYADGSSPLTPVNKSPVDTMDKIKLSLGNSEGQIKYLKSKFEDAVKDKDGDLMVKDQGVWHRVDPKTFDAPDPWEATKIIAGKIPGMAGGALDIGGQMAGAAVGAVGGPAGAIAGGATGAGLGEAARTSLGRLAGTYEATPDQQVKDIGWEGLLGAGGEVVSMGVKPTFRMLKKSLSNIGEYGSNFVKENMAEFWGGYTGTGKEMVRRAIDAPSEVIGKANQAIKSVGIGSAPSEAKLYAGKIQDSLINTITDDSKTALQSNYRKQQYNLLQQVPDSFSANVSGMMKEVQQGLVDSGYGKMVGPAGNQKFMLNSMEDMAQGVGLSSEQLPKIFGEKTEKAMKDIGNMVNQYSKFGTLEGKGGARQLLDLKKAMGESFDDFFGPDVPQSIQRNAAQLKDQINQKIGQSFVDHGVGEQYVQMNSQYSKYKDIVDRLVNYKDKGQQEQVVKYLTSKTGANRSFKDDVASLAGLLGESGQKKMNDVMDWEAAKGFIDFTPAKGGNSFESAKKAVGTVTQIGNPRVIGGMIDYGNRTLDLLKSIPPSQIKKFLSNDEAVSTMTKSVVHSLGNEDKNTQNLLQMGGVMPGGQPNGQ